MSLESSETEFTTRFAPFAVSGVLYPQPEGSPLLEFAASGRVLYLFDRNGPYAAAPGPARVVVHAVVEALARVEAPGDGTPQLLSTGVSQVEGVGRVLDVQRWFCVVEARVPLVLAGFVPWPELSVGDWVSFRTAPPLHGFII